MAPALSIISDSKVTQSRLLVLPRPPSLIFQPGPLSYLP